MTARKSAGVKKKTAGKKAAKKGAGSKKSTGKKAARKKAARSTRKARRVGVRGVFDGELPETFIHMSRRVREGLRTLEKEVADTEARYRKGFMRVLDEVTHQLGQLESLSEERWHTLGDNARRDLAELLRKLEKVVAPGPSRKRRGRKKAASRKKAKSRKKAARTKR